jgi:hypothetical protein
MLAKTHRMRSSAIADMFAGSEGIVPFISFTAFEVASPISM